MQINNNKKEIGHYNEHVIDFYYKAYTWMSPNSQIQNITINYLKYFDSF